MRVPGHGQGGKRREPTHPRDRRFDALPGRGICARRRRGIRAAGFRSCGTLLANTKKRTESVSPPSSSTRSTFAEATAGRESLRPSALRARCTRKATRRFNLGQERYCESDRKLRHFRFTRGFPIRIAPRDAESMQKCTEPGAPSSGLPTDLRRSDCLSESHQSRALRPRCTRDTRAFSTRRQAGRKCECRCLRTFPYNANTFA